MTSLTTTFGSTKLSPRSSKLRRSPGRARAILKNSARHSFDENVANGASSPLQFDMSPAALRQPPQRSLSLVSPVPTHNESDSEHSASLSSSSRTSSSEFSSCESTLVEDDFLARLTRDLSSVRAVPTDELMMPPVSSEQQQQQPSAAPVPVVAGGTRRYLSMSANLYVNRPSPPNVDEPPKLVKKNLFTAIHEEPEEDEKEKDDSQTFRWERSASMMDLSTVAFAVPTAVRPAPSAPLRQSPPPMASRLSSVPTVVQPPVRLLPSPRALSSLSQRSSSMALIPMAREVQKPLRDPLRRRASVMIDDATQRDASAAEKKRIREALPAPDLPDLQRKSSSEDVAPFVPSLAHEFRVALPLVQNLKHDGINTISCATVRDILNGSFVSQFRSIYILDCRFDYEFVGGHIRGAVHANNPEVLVDRFFKHRIEAPACFIFHCEFSSKRGPSQLKLMRELDRKANQDAYPHLFYPELYLMENGYCEFFRQFPELCDPQDYIRMDDEQFRDRLKGNLVMRQSLKKKRRPSVTDEAF